jgi:predicted transposase YdaD
MYKFPTLDREAIRQMLGLDELKQTKFYQEVLEDTLVLAVPALLEAGLTTEQIATQLKTDVATVERIIREQQNSA